jgi:aryl-alcohol dehydrogenase-like predicted oxidoreductase
MQYRNVGRTGLKVSSVSIGGWLTLGGSVELDASVRILHTAVDHGINFIDLADVYARGRAEEAAGQFLREYTAGDGRERSDLVISGPWARDRTHGDSAASTSWSP